MGKIRKILVVCTGNSCRSPMAEAFLKKALACHDGYEVVSSGISAPTGFSPTKEAIAVMKKEGLDISSYMSKPFSPSTAKTADIILVMESGHKEIITREYPELIKKVFLYNEFAYGKTPTHEEDIMDPIGQPAMVYQAVMEKIKKASEKISQKIKETE